MTYIPFPNPIPDTNPYPAPGCGGGPVAGYIDQTAFLAAAINRLAAAIEVYNAQKTDK